MTQLSTDQISDRVQLRGAKRFATNATALFGARIFDSVVALVATGLVARHLGKELFGVYILARAVAGVLATFINCGVDTIATREISRRHERAAECFAAACLLTLTLALLACGFTATLVNALGWSVTVRHAVYAALFAVTTQVFTLIVSGAIQAYERMEFDAIKLVLNQTVYLIMVAVGVSILPKQEGVVWFLLAIGVGNMCDIIFGVTLLRLKFFRPRWQANLQTCKFLLREGFPLGVRRLLRNMGLKIDTFVLNAMKSKAEVGLFGGVYRILSQLRLVPNVLNTTLFPGFARKWAQEPAGLLLAYERAMRFILTLALPIAVGITMLSAPLVTLILGNEYAAARTPMAVLSWGLMLMFLSSVLLMVLNAIDKQHLGTIACALALGLNFACDLLLIPPWSYNGAALASVLAEVTLFALCYNYVCKHVGSINLAALLCKPALAALLMATAMWAVRGAPMPVVALTGVTAYAAGILALRTFSAEEISLLKAAFSRSRA